MSDPNSPQMAEEPLLGDVPSLSDEQWDGMLEDTFIAPPGMADHLVDLFDDPAGHDPADYTDDAIDPDALDDEAVFGDGMDVGAATDASATQDDTVEDAAQPEDDAAAAHESSAAEPDSRSIFDDIFTTTEFSDDAAAIDTGEFGSDQELGMDDAGSDEMNEADDLDNDFGAADGGSDAFLV